MSVSAGNASTSRASEVDVGRWIAGRQTDERGNAVVNDLLISRSLSDAWGI